MSVRPPGWLPYSLSWISTLTESVTETGFAFTAEGDFNGTGRWIFRQDGSSVVLAFDWQVTVDKPVVRRLTLAVWPLFTGRPRWRWLAVWKASGGIAPRAGDAGTRCLRRAARRELRSFLRSR